MIFIVGNSRSGTKLLGDILSNSQPVFTFTELHFIEYLVSTDKIFNKCSKEEAILLINKLFSIQENGFLDPKKFNKSNLDNFYKISEIIYDKYKCETYYDCYQNFLIYYTKGIKKKSVPCDPTPRNQFFIKEIKNHSPASKIIYAIRDPRAVLYSQKKKWKISKKSKSKFEVFRTLINYNPIIISLLWKSSAKQYINNQDKVLLVIYEKMVDNQKATIKSLCNYVSIPFSESLLDVSRTNSSHANTTKIKGVTNFFADLWKKELSHTEIWICQLINNDYLAEFGYSPIKLKPNPLKLFYYFLTLPVYMVLVFFSNFSRYKNILNSFRTRFK